MQYKPWMSQYSFFLWFLLWEHYGYIVSPGSFLLSEFPNVEIQLYSSICLHSLSSVSIYSSVFIVHRLVSYAWKQHEYRNVEVVI